PGELFVHRNIANVVSPDDPNCVAVVQYAVEVLRVKHIIVCGHYECGGVGAAIGEPLQGSLERWIQHIRDVYSAHWHELQQLPDHETRHHRLCELNVIALVEHLCRVSAVREAWLRGTPLMVHGWIYDLRDGLLRDLRVTVASA